LIILEIILLETYTHQDFQQPHSSTSSHHILLNSLEFYQL